MKPNRSRKIQTELKGLRGEVQEANPQPPNWPTALRDGWLTLDEFKTIEHLIGNRAELQKLGLSRIDIEASAFHGVKIRLVEESGKKPRVPRPD